MVGFSKDGEVGGEENLCIFWRLASVWSTQLGSLQSIKESAGFLPKIKPLSSKDGKRRKSTSWGEGPALESLSAYFLRMPPFPLGLSGSSYYHCFVFALSPCQP